MEPKEDKVISHMFDNIDEQDISIIIKHVARRMLLLRSNSSHASFWFNALTKFNKWIVADLKQLTQQEIEAIKNPPVGSKGWLLATRMVRERTGLGLQAAKKIVDQWLKDNGSST